MHAPVLNERARLFPRVQAQLEGRESRRHPHLRAPAPENLAILIYVLVEPVCVREEFLIIGCRVDQIQSFWKVRLEVRFWELYIVRR